MPDLRFLLDGERLPNHLTPLDLELDHNDMICVMHAQGACKIRRILIKNIIQVSFDIYEELNCVKCYERRVISDIKLAYSWEVLKVVDKEEECEYFFVSRILSYH
jgi:hypothetical protein